jgi:hypothetical protein
MSMPKARCPAVEPSRHNQPRDRRSCLCAKSEDQFPIPRFYRVSRALIPGTSSVKHLRENVAGAGLQLPDESINELNAIAG